MQRFGRREKWLIAGIVLVALAMRVAIVVAQFDQIAVDRDGYRAIALNLAAGRGFSTSPPSAADPQPTAYRPPLYPLLLAGIFRVSAGEVGIAVLHVLLGTATVLLTFLAGRRLRMGRAAFIAAGLVAVDPLLLWYTVLPMTETLCTFLVALLLWALAGNPAPGSADLRRPSFLRMAIIGGGFGLCFLCRPTIAAFGLLGGIWWLLHELRTTRRLPFFAWPALLAFAVVVAPWLVRNLSVFGRPIVTTTHGGYTLLLGNNPVFYHEVVARPWGTVWDDAPAGRTQADWLKRVEAELHDELGPRANWEPARDGWMFRRAVQHIRDEPSLFLRACLLRFVRFWNIVPLPPARGGVPPPVIWCVGSFYGIEIAAFLAGTVIVIRGRRRDWYLLLLLVASFCLVHLFYWSNVRMRAPVVPAMALVSGLGIGCVRRDMIVSQQLRAHRS